MPKPLNFSDASDHEVVARAREGDEDAYHEIVRRYGHAMFEFIHRMVGHHIMGVAAPVYYSAFTAGLLAPQCHHGIHGSRTLGRYERSEQRHGTEHTWNSDESERVHRAHAIE